MTRDDLGPRLVRAALVSLLILLPGVAMAQHTGPGSWIPANPAYVTDSGMHCCGTSHCTPLTDGEIERTGSGWLHVPTQTELSDKSRAIYLTADPERKLFACVWGGKLQCLFLKGEG